MHFEQHLKMKHVPANWLRTAASAIVSTLAMISFRRGDRMRDAGWLGCWDDKWAAISVSISGLCCMWSSSLGLGSSWSWMAHGTWHMACGMWLAPASGLRASAWELMHDWHCANLFQVLAETESGVLISMTNRAFHLPFFQGNLDHSPAARNQGCLHRHSGRDQGESDRWRSLQLQGEC